MQYGDLVGYAMIQARKIPRATYERWKMLLRSWNKGVEQRILELIKQDLRENWTGELEEAFRDVYGLKEE